jgi:hypothetical protein
LGDAYGGEVGFDRVEGKGKGEFADIGFDGDLLERDDADKYGGSGFDLGASDGWESRVVFEKPDEGMSVEEEGHRYT